MLVPTFRSSSYVSAPTLTNFGKVMGTSKSIILLPLFNLKFLTEFAACGAGTSYRRRLLQIRFEGVDGNLDRGVGFRTPQFGTVKDHGVEPLRIFAQFHRGGVRENLAAQNALDQADMAACIAGKTRMRGWMDVLCPHAIPRFEWGGRGRGAFELAAHQALLDILKPQLAVLHGLR